MAQIIINNKRVKVRDGISVMNAITESGIEVPHFCYHKRLEIAGNCRMCLVEIEKSPKLVASCATQISEGMSIKTNTERVTHARKGVMELLLINHPLDCPVCDEGGECDLQDQAIKYGKGTGRFLENKRLVKEKNLGPLIKTVMTRCIHCTRCVRFATDIAGVEEIGAINRGENTEITTYLKETLTSELSGNMIDLCPVGALTAKPYAFKARSWELKKTDSIDIMDALGSNISIHSRGDEIIRVLPRVNDKINEEWISDKIRFSHDGLKVQRLDNPYIKKNRRLSKVDWKDAISYIAKHINSINGEKIAAIAGDLTSVESMFLVKKLLSHLGSNKIDANQRGHHFDISTRGNYLFNTSIEGIDKSDFCLLIGTNLRHSSPVLNARIGKNVRSGKLKVSRIGEADDQTYHIEEFGNKIDLLNQILKGKHDLANKLKSSTNPMIIIGDAVSLNPDGYGIISLIHQIAQNYNIVRPDWNGLNMTHNHASSVGALDIGFHYGKDGTKNILNQTKNGQVKILFLIGADEIDVNEIGDDCFVIYQGHNGSKSAEIADVILPEASYMEQDGIFVNMEGKMQYANKAVNPVGKAKESWKIISEISTALDVLMPINSLDDARKMLRADYSLFNKIDTIHQNITTPFQSPVREGIIISKIEYDYYKTNIISRFSNTMHKCSTLKKESI